MPNAITNVEFGRRVGCSHSMASRIINGHRLPSIDVIERIRAEYDVDLDAMLDARRQGAQAFGVLMREQVIAPANRRSAASA